MGGTSADVYRTKGSHTIIVSCVDKVKSKSILYFCIFSFFHFPDRFYRSLTNLNFFTPLRVSMGEFLVRGIEFFSKTVQSNLLAAGVGTTISRTIFADRFNLEMVIVQTG